MSRPLICPIDRSAMLPGEDGVWRCRRTPGHVFRVEGAGPAPSGGSGHCYSNMPCPACGEEMTTVPGRPGEWRCILNHGHVFTVPVVNRMPEADRVEPIRRSPLIDRATGGVPLTHWLAPIGITTVLLPPPQGNTGPGDYCQPLGSIEPGGGSKSGRKKRKKPKPARRLLEDPWGA